MGEVTARDAARVQAALEGAYARRDGLPVQNCPYDPASSDAVESYLARYWIKGWNRATR